MDRQRQNLSFPPFGIKKKKRIVLEKIKQPISHLNPFELRLNLIPITAVRSWKRLLYINLSNRESHISNSPSQTEPGRPFPTSIDYSISKTQEHVRASGTTLQTAMRKSQPSTEGKEPLMARREWETSHRYQTTPCDFI
ncbi:hypothetical protein EUGRSUZ_A01398 [Eucalyptus grandis]|uniref:Uncharacterized protein n=2 Tax=Eucalyptus grandis TaxID=71139 RepID=A0ACC3M3K9_EUCGR|nr:hypothetical protein EUGRSUZ_A01398 [Eucalyptus grandis]